MEPLRILCGREIQNSIADSVHQLLCDQIKALDLSSFYRTTDKYIEGANGTTFGYAGLRQQDITKLKSFEGADRVWIEEAQSVTLRSWRILTPTVRKPGSEIWCSFNPELDTDETYQRFVVNPPDGAVVAKVNYCDNPWFTPELEKERQDCIRRYGIESDEYRNIWLGEPRSVVEGAIYRKEIIALHADKRFRPVPYDPMLKVHTVWDLGWNDQMSIILAQVNRGAGEMRIIEYIEDSHRVLTDYVMELKERRYNFGTDWLPHDGEAKDYKTGKSAQEILQGLGRQVRITPKTEIENGIKAARMLFGRCYFDRDKTVRLVDCLKRYRRAINANTNEPGAPLHDEYSHGADAFRYLALVADKLTNDDHTKMKPINYPNLGLR
jgi:phage terminase large subunit